MRKILFPTVVVLALFVSSCKKESIGRIARMQPDETINVKIAANQSLSLDLSNSGVVKIIKQAANFSVSETVVNTVKGGFNYNYIPAKGFTGKDEVVFLSTITALNTLPLPGITAGGCNANDRGNNSVSIVSKNIILKLQVGD